jgi:GNAT superfamily N-acetyltransferase
MILEPFSPKKHSVEEVAGLIYDTEPVYFSLVFGRDRTLALRKIENLVRTGGNAFGRENITCAVREGKVVGVLIMQTPHSPGLGEEFSVIARAAGPVTAIRYLLAEWLIFAPNYVNYPRLQSGACYRGGVACSLRACDSTSPRCRGADRNRPVDSGPGSDAAALWCGLRQSHVTVIHRKGTPLLRAFCSATRSLWALPGHKEYPCGGKVYRDPSRADTSPDSSRGAPRPTILKRTPEPGYYISNLSVIPAERGEGISAALLEDAVRKVRSRGGGKIVLSVIAPNPAAVRLYERAGYRTASTHRAWVPHQTLSVLTMVYDAGQQAASQQ